MKDQKSFALLDELIIIILTVSFFFASPAKAVEGDHVAISSEQLFDFCRAETIVSQVTCGAYLVAVWDILSGNPYVCMDTDIKDDDTLAKALSQIISQIRVTSGYPEQYAAVDAVYAMFQTNNMFVICPNGRGDHV